MSDLRKVIAAVERFVRDNSEQAEHLIRTAYWVKKLTPHPSKALIVAALMHDIERAISKNRKPPRDEFKVSWDDKEYIRWHEDRSAQIAHDFLRKQSANPKFIEHVVSLIKAHEEGGWEEADILKDADSISVLEVVIPFFISHIPRLFTKRQIEEKVKLMYRRITLTEAKRTARPFYEKALKMLKAV